MSEIEAMLKSGTAADRVQAIVSLGGLGEAARVHLPDVVELLTDPTPAVRWAAVDAIERIGLDAESGKEIMISLFDKQSELTYSTMWVLQKLLRRDPLNMFKEWFNDRNSWTRAMAVCVMRAAGLERLGIPVDSAVELLAGMLPEADETVIGEAVDLLAELGPTGVDRAEEALISLLESTLYDYAVCHALASLNSPRADEALLKRLEAEDLGARVVAAESLAKRGPELRNVALLAMKALRDHSDARVREQVAHVLATAFAGAE